MHCGQIGLPQTRHWSVLNWPGCFRHIFGALAVASAAGSLVVALAVCSFTWRRGAAGAAATATACGKTACAGTGTGCDAITTAMGFGGGALCVTVAPNCWQMIWFTAAELSAPQLWQTSCTGFAIMSGVISNAYFVPQLHCIFMAVLG